MSRLAGEGVFEISFAGKPAPTEAINPPIGGFFVPEFQAKKSQRLRWL